MNSSRLKMQYDPAEAVPAEQHSEPAVDEDVMPAQ
jgi:hypothetical protein